MANSQNNEVIQNPFRYNTIMNKLRDFRCGIEGDQFDEPGWFYFKIFFYFNEGKEASNRMSSGLLGCNFQQVDEYIKNGNYKVIHDNSAKIPDAMNANSAYNYLRLNGEEERAGKLKDFIRILSDISTNKPWYFQSIEGLNTAMERKLYTDGELKLEDKPRELSIKCLSDAYDTRIGTLLDLYKDIAFSYSQKKEVLPANLRKFDMGIFIYSKPIRQLITDEFSMGGVNFNKKEASKMGGEKMRNQKAIQQYPLYDNDTSSRFSVKQQDLKTQNAAGNFYASCKYIEFQNCEIEYNSGTSGYSTITNADGFPMDYTIKILFDDCYEERYNEFLVKTIGDFVARDFYKDLLPNSSYKNTQEPLTTSKYNERYVANWKKEAEQPLKATANLSGEEPKEDRPSGPLSNAVGQLFGAAMSDVNQQMHHIAMGNLAEYGLNSFTSMVNNVASGNVFAAAAGINAFNNRNNKPASPTISENSLGQTNSNPTGFIGSVNPKSLGSANNNNSSLNTYPLGEPKEDNTKVDRRLLGEAEESNEKVNNRLLGEPQSSNTDVDRRLLGEPQNNNTQVTVETLGEAEDSTVQITVQELDATGNNAHIGHYQGEYTAKFIGNVDPKSLNNKKIAELKKINSARNLMNNIR